MIRTGRGTAGCFYSLTVPNAPNPCTANVLMRDDGSLNIQMGIVDIGQGAETAMCMMAAEFFTIPVETVSIHTADTGATPYDFGTLSSRLTFVGGRALLKACEELMAVLKDAAAKQLHTEPHRLYVEGGFLKDKYDPHKMLPIAAAAAISQYVFRKVPMGQGEYYPFNVPVDDSGKGEPSVSYNYHATVVDVEVDDETGVVRVKEIWSAVDCGKAINPNAVVGQCDGGTLQGIAWALGEDMYPYLTNNAGPAAEFDPNFRPRNLSDYPIPTTMDAPVIHSMYVESHDGEGPFGAKAAGEICANTAAPAIINAIYDAVGVRITELPATPDRVLKALREKREKEGA